MSAFPPKICQSQVPESIEGYFRACHELPGALAALFSMWNTRARIAGASATIAESADRGKDCLGVLPLRDGEGETLGWYRGAAMSWIGPCFTENALMRPC